MVAKLKQFGSGLFLGLTILSLTSAYIILSDDGGRHMHHTVDGKPYIVYTAPTK